MSPNTPATDLSSTSHAFAAQLRAERAARGWTQAELGKRAGMSRQTVLRFEAAERDMNTTQLAAFCEAFGISLLEFATRAEARVGQEGQARRSGAG